MKPFLFGLKTVALFAFLIYFVPYVALIFAVCGLYDVLRNRALTFDTLNRYFWGNGMFTWLLSPFNTLLDLLALPYLNKGVYKLADLPPAYQAEIQTLIDAAHHEDLIGKVEARTQDEKRSMIFWKWYGSNVETFVTIPAFHQKYRYIRTIGLSVFNKKQSTSRHFGPLRPTLRVLYNINKMEDRSAYIEANNVFHYWQDEQLFIFDDTLLHQSHNKGGAIRYCLFVDIVRPSLMAPVFSGIVYVMRFLLQSVNYIFYRNWTVIKN